MHLTRRPPVVFVTGRYAEQDIQRSLEAGAVNYVKKPFGVEFADRLLSHIKNRNDSFTTGKRSMA